MKFPILTSVIIFVIILSFAIKRSNRQMEQDSEAFFERERRANTVRKKSLDNLNYIQIPTEILSMDIGKICADYASLHNLEAAASASSSANSTQKPEEDTARDPEAGSAQDSSLADKQEGSLEETVQTPEADSAQDSSLADKQVDSSEEETARDPEEETAPETELSEEYLSFKKMEEQLQNCMENLKELSREKIVNFTGVSNTDLKLTYGTANITPLMEYDQNYTTLAMELQEFATLLIALDAEEEAIKVLEFAISTKTDISGTYKSLASLYKKNRQTQKIDPLIQQAKELPTVMSASIVKHLEEISQTAQSSDP